MASSSEPTLYREALVSVLRTSQRDPKPQQTNDTLVVVSGNSTYRTSPRFGLNSLATVALHYLTDPYNCDRLMATIVT